MSPGFSRRFQALPPATRRDWWLALFICLATSVIIVSPFFWLGTASGHDFEFHAASWLDVEGQWREGTVFPRWTEWANRGYGEPRFIFYPPLSWLAGAALGSLIPWVAVPCVLIILTQTLAGLAAFAFARSLLPTRSSLFCAVCYAANPYALLIVYVRSDFAEQLALAFFPLLVLFALRLTGVLHSKRSAVQDFILFGIFFASVWLSNAPAGVLATYASVLLFCWIGVTAKSFKSISYGAGAMLIGFALSAFYLIPAAYEQRWVNIDRVLTAGLLPSDNFLFTITNDPEHTWFNWIASSVFVLIVILSLLAALFTHYSSGDKIEDSTFRQKVWGLLLVLTAAATVGSLRLSQIAWDLLPKLRFVQFPWRWMFVLALPFAYYSGSVLESQYTGERRRFAMFGAPVIMVCLVGVAGELVQQTWWDTEDLTVLQEAIRSGQGVEGTDEYDPVGDDHYAIPEKSSQFQVLASEDSAPQAGDTMVTIVNWNGEHKNLKILSSQPVRIAICLLNYPAWKIMVNGIPLQPGRLEEINQMVIPVESGESNIDILFTRTWDRTLGGLISAVTWMAIIIFYVACRRHNLTSERRRGILRGPH